MNDAAAAPEQPYTPNHIPVGQRWLYGVVSAVAIAYGSYGIWVDDIYIPGKRSSGIHFHGLAAWLVYAGMLCLSANFLSVIVDHFDRRNNERNYRLFARVTSWAGWISYLSALLLFLLGGTSA